MSHAAWARNSEYGRLRAEYDAAFAELCAAQPPVGPNSTDAVQARFEKALGAYRECRQRLALFLTGREAPALRHDEVKALAHRLWEEAGRPVGNPEQHWYQAESLVRSARH